MDRASVPGLVADGDCSLEGAGCLGRGGSGKGGVGAESKGLHRRVSLRCIGKPMLLFRTSTTHSS